MNLNNLKNAIGNTQQVFAVAWMKKYSLVGTLLNTDKKYFLKEFLFISAYSNACLNINHFILWPVCLSLIILPTLYLLMELIIGKIEDWISSKKE